MPISAADMSDRAVQDSGLHTEDHPGNDHDSIADKRELRSSKESLMLLTGATYERTEAMTTKKTRVFQEKCAPDVSDRFLPILHISRND